MLLKQNSPSLPRNKAFGVFLEIGNSVFSKGKSAIPPLFNGPEVLPSATDKAKLFAENFSKNSSLDDSAISLPVFPCIPVVVLKNCESELSYILAELFNKCLMESCFPDCWKVSSVVPVFKAYFRYF